MMPRMIVTAQLIGDDGVPVWGFHRDEVVVNPSRQEEAHEHALETGQRILDTIDTAKESVGAQIAATARAMEDGRG